MSDLGMTKEQVAALIQNDPAAGLFIAEKHFGLTPEKLMAEYLTKTPPEQIDEAQAKEAVLARMMDKIEEDGQFVSQEVSDAKSGSTKAKREKAAKVPKEPKVKVPKEPKVKVPKVKLSPVERYAASSRPFREGTLFNIIYDALCASPEASSFLNTVRDTVLEKTGAPIKFSASLAVSRVKETMIARGWKIDVVDGKYTVSK